MSTYQIPAQIRKLLPRLTSNHDGEVTATARAIERILQGAGLDWHDLATTIGRPHEEPSGLRDMAEALGDAPGLNAWETKFIADIRRLLAAGVRLSVKQEQALRRTYARHGSDDET